MRSRLVDTVLRVIGCCLGSAAGLAAFASMGWIPDKTVNDSSTITKNCGGIVDTVGAIASWTPTVNAHDIRTTASIGARWNGSQYEHATEPANSPPKKNTSEHHWKRDGGTTYKYLTVTQTSTPYAEGQCHQMVAEDPEWWFTPSCTTWDQPPKLYYDDNGQWVQQGFDWYDPNNQSGSGSVTVDIPPGTSTGTAQSGGTQGSFGAKKTLPNTTNKAKIYFEYDTVTSADSDNTIVDNMRAWLSADCRSAVASTQ